MIYQCLFLCIVVVVVAVHNKRAPTLYPHHAPACNEAVHTNAADVLLLLPLVQGLESCGGAWCVG